MKNDKIYDEFADLCISRQRKYQLRKLKEGKCIKCGKEADGRKYCEYHKRMRKIKKMGDSHIVSKGERDFLNHLLIPLHQIPIDSIVVDGLLNNVIYEYLGDYWHGNPILYESTKLNQRAKKTFGELYRDTFNRFDKLKKKGYTIKYIWENDWKKFASKKVGRPNIREY